MTGSEGADCMYKTHSVVGPPKMGQISVHRCGIPDLTGMGLPNVEDVKLLDGCKRLTRWGNTEVAALKDIQVRDSCSWKYLWEDQSCYERKNDCRFLVHSHSDQRRSETLDSHDLSRALS